MSPCKWCVFADIAFSCRCFNCKAFEHTGYIPAPDVQFFLWTWSYGIGSNPECPSATSAYKLLRAVLPVSVSYNVSISTEWARLSIFESLANQEIFYCLFRPQFSTQDKILQSGKVNCRQGFYTLNQAVYLHLKSLQYLCFIAFAISIENSFWHYLDLSVTFCEIAE